MRPVAHLATSGFRASPGVLPCIRVRGGVRGDAAGMAALVPTAATRRPFPGPPDNCFSRQAATASPAAARLSGEAFVGLERVWGLVGLGSRFGLGLVLGWIGCDRGLMVDARGASVGSVQIVGRAATLW